jgi:hypothetical protein
MQEEPTYSFDVKGLARKHYINKTLLARKKTLHLHLLLWMIFF